MNFYIFTKSRLGYSPVWSSSTSAPGDMLLILKYSFATLLGLEGKIIKRFLHWRKIKLINILKKQWKIIFYLLFATIYNPSWRSKLGSGRLFVLNQHPHTPTHFVYTLPVEPIFWRSNRWYVVRMITSILVDIIRTQVTSMVLKLLIPSKIFTELKVRWIWASYLNISINFRMN